MRRLRAPPEEVLNPPLPALGRALVSVRKAHFILPPLPPKTENLSWDSLLLLLSDTNAFTA